MVTTVGAFLRRYLNIYASLTKRQKKKKKKNPWIELF